MSDLRWWFGFARPYLGWFILGIAASVLTVSASMALLAVSGWFIASMAVAGAAGTDFNYFTPAAIIRLLAILRTGGRYVERLITHDATLRLLTGLRVWFYQQVEPLSVQTLHGLRGGDLLGRIRADIDILDHVYLRLVTPVVVGVLCVVLAVAVLACYSLPVALMNLAILLTAGIALPIFVERAGWAPGQCAVTIAATLRADVVDTIEGLGELIVFGATAERRTRVDGLSRQWVASQKRLSHLTGLSSAGLLLLTHMAVLGTAWLLVPLVRSQQLTPVDFAPAMLWVMGCFEAVAQMPVAWQALGQTRAATRRLRMFEAMRPAIVEPASPASPPEDNTLCFDHASARYAPDAPWALADISTTIAPGERVAIVGASGAGKSTFIQLLLRLVSHESGVICWGGRPLSDYRSADLRARLGAVPQSVYLFHTTVRENILVGDPQADEPAMFAAARIAGIHEEIMAMSAGYDTVVGEEGLRLSGGQIRRVGIARALLRDAPVILMDEPTEGLDSAAETRLWEALDRHLSGHTLIFVSHRMAWVRRATRILVLEQGRLIASGDHETLWATSAAYRRLQAQTQPTVDMDDALVLPVECFG